MNIVNLSAKYGRVPELDCKVGNVREVIKNGNPNKRYFLITNENTKEYFVNLIDARFILKHHSELYRDVTTDDLQEELSTRGTRIKGGKYATVVEESFDYFTIKFRDIKYNVPFQSVMTEGGAV